MIIAAFGEVRGNLPALTAVLNAIDEEGIQTILNTGNSAVGAPWSNDVIECLRARTISCVQGEMDRLLLRFRRKNPAFQKNLAPDQYRVLEKAFDEVTSANLEYLRGLPKTRALTVDGIPIALCHGTLTNQSQSLRFDDPDERFRRQREIMPVSIIVCGNSVDGFVRRVDDTLFVNPGTAGGEASARFAVISTEQEPWTAELRTVIY